MSHVKSLAWGVAGGVIAVFLLGKGFLGPVAGGIVIQDANKQQINPK